MLSHTFQISVCYLDLGEATGLGALIDDARNTGFVLGGWDFTLRMRSAIVLTLVGGRTVHAGRCLGACLGRSFARVAMTADVCLRDVGLDSRPTAHVIETAHGVLDGRNRGVRIGSRVSVLARGDKGFAVLIEQWLRLDLVATVALVFSETIRFGAKSWQSSQFTQVFLQVVVRREQLAVAEIRQERTQFVEVDC